LTTGTAAEYSVFIIDDHPLTRGGVRELIEHQHDLTVVGEATGDGDVMSNLRSSCPDVVLLDLRLPGGSGLSLLKQIKSICPGAGIIVHSMQDPRVYAPRSLENGAKGFVEKTAEPEHLLMAIRAVLAGDTYVWPPMTDPEIDPEAQSESPPDPVAVLTDRELEVLSFIGRGKSTREIADACDLSVKTIETHRDKLKRKLNIQSTSELVRFAVQWLLESER